VTVSVRENEIFAACRVLFGPDIQLSQEFLNYLQASGARSAYRRRAKEIHPDLVAGADELVRREHSRLFRQLAEAFDLVTGFLESRTGATHDTPAAAKSAHRDRRPPPQREARKRTDRSGYYCGGVPARPMQIGLYLYYRGMISYSELMEALLWQRQQRPRLGAIARRWGWLSAEDVHSILRGAQVGRFGDRAVAMELLTPFRLKTLLNFQRCRQQRLGDFFLERKILKVATLERLAAELIEHNRRCRDRSPHRQSRQTAS
jgi:hypothetical protein